MFSEDDRKTPWPKLLSRNDFRNGVFKRDNYQCVVCGDKDGPHDAHHIVDRRLWSKPEEMGGYFLDNGATVCNPCHIKCEETTISCDELRDSCGITKILIPFHLVSDERYDKWANIILENNQRMPGELFHDESVQKILAQGKVLDLFTQYIKYSRTFHLPWSNASSDDKTLSDVLHFEGKEIVVTEKYDGENCTLYNDYLHARSINNNPHPSRAWVKKFHAEIQSEIPPGWRICGENLFAKHSIRYDDLESYFLCFSIWNDKNICLDWDETKEWAELIGIQTVRELYRGVWDEKLIKNIQLDTKRQEGYVVRLAGEFSYRAFTNSVAKFVRKDHVTTDSHWRHQVIIPNNLKKHDCKNRY